MQKVAFQGLEDFSGIWECKRPPSGDLKSLEDFSGMGAGKKATARTSCCNFHNATTPATEEPTTAETLASACMGASKSMSKDKSMDASNSRVSTEEPWTL